MNGKKKLHLPHVITLIFVLIVFVAIKKIGRAHV